VRAFFAIPLPGRLCEELAAAARGIDGLRAQRPETIHLTVRFLGEIEDPDAFAAAAAPAVADCAPYELEVCGLGCFPGSRRPARVLWAGVTRGADETRALSAGLEAALAPLGVEPERRGYTPHVTLGRFRAPRRLAPEVLDPRREFGRTTAARLILYSSRLTPQGAVHEALHELSLGVGMKPGCDFK